MGELKVCWSAAGPADDGSLRADRRKRERGHGARELGLRARPRASPAAIGEYVAAGYDEVYVMQMGPDQAGMIDFYRRDVLPRAR